MPESELKDTSLNGSVIFRPQYMRKNFEIDSKIESARLYITSKGVFELQLNGEKVGIDIMTPGFTTYQKRIETLTYDVTELLQKGDNTIGAIVAEGWYAGKLIFQKGKKEASNIPRLICQLEIKLKNGETQTILSDENWKATQNGPIRTSGIYNGETYNANLELNGWSSNGFDDKSWIQVVTKPMDSAVLLSSKRHLAVIDKKELSPINILKTDSNAIFDFGQNMVGVPRIKVPIKKGDTLVIRFAEMLQNDSTLYTVNYRGAKSTDYYIAKEDGIIEYIPKFTFHGFRFIELSNFDKSKEPEKSWITGIVHYSDFNMNGTFSSSHAKLNQLQSNITWGLRGNFFDIPTDCPQRDERMGWTGDAQVFAKTSVYNADVLPFWAAWLQTMRDDQTENGGIPIIVPNIAGNRTSSGWGDACTVIPWDLYVCTGNTRILEENYNMMKKWVQYYRSLNKNQIVSMFTFGDWLQPFSTNKKNDRKGETSEELINTAYYAKSVTIAMQTAGVLGFKDDSVSFHGLLDSIKTSFQNYFFDENGKTTKGIEAQTGYLLAINFDLLTDKMKQMAIPHLIAQIKKADNHLRTGFLGTPILCPLLDNIGRSDLAFEILFQETYPSWFYSINQGATTMWERWNSYTHKDGFNPGGMNSFNHYAYGAIGQFMYERITGIKALKPGYKEILIALLPGGPLTSAKATYNSPFGEISSEWKIENGIFHLKTIIPPNTKAKIIIPANVSENLLFNGNPFAENVNVTLVKKEDGAFELEALPGSYLFESKIF